MSEQHGKETFNPERSDEYNTPPAVTAHVHAFFGFDGIDLDPATSPDNPTDAHHFFTPADDGLSQSWQGYESIFINPPYEPAWYRKLATEAQGPGELVALLKASPCTKWFQEIVLPPASSVCFLLGRLTFGDQTAPAGFGSVLVYYGPQVRRFAKYFSPIGWVVPTNNQSREI